MGEWGGSGGGDGSGGGKDERTLWSMKEEEKGDPKHSRLVRARPERNIFFSFLWSLAQ
jgi:hypothetical protein